MLCLQRVWLLILIQCRLGAEGLYNPLLLKDSWFEIAHNVGWGLHVNMQQNVKAVGVEAGSQLGHSL